MYRRTCWSTFHDAAIATGNMKVVTITSQIENPSTPTNHESPPTRPTVLRDHLEAGLARLELRQHRRPRPRTRRGGAAARPTARRRRASSGHSDQHGHARPAGRRSRGSARERPPRPSPPRTGAARRRPPGTTARTGAPCPICQMRREPRGPASEPPDAVDRAVDHRAVEPGQERGSPQARRCATTQRRGRRCRSRGRAPPAMPGSRSGNEIQRSVLAGPIEHARRCRCPATVTHDRDRDQRPRSTGPRSPSDDRAEHRLEEGREPAFGRERQPDAGEQAPAANTTSGAAHQPGGLVRVAPRTAARRRTPGRTAGRCTRPRRIAASEPST